MNTSKLYQHCFPDQPQVSLQWIHGPDVTAEGRHGERVHPDVGAKVQVDEIILLRCAKNKP